MKRRKFDLQELRRRMVEIDYRHKHRHLPGSLSALPIIAQIYEEMDLENDVFILSKGHSCAALYCVLEACGYKPDVSLVHPERDIASGVTMTAGSLGHGLPTAVGIAWAKRHMKQPGIVHVLFGDGECQEGSVYEALNLAARFNREATIPLIVHVDYNGYQGSEILASDSVMMLSKIFTMEIHFTRKGQGIARFEANPEKSVHLIADAEFAEIMEELA